MRWGLPSLVSILGLLPRGVVVPPAGTNEGLNLEVLAFPRGVVVPPGVVGPTGWAVAGLLRPASSAARLAARWRASAAVCALAMAASLMATAFSAACRFASAAAAARAFTFSAASAAAAAFAALCSLPEPHTAVAAAGAFSAALAGFSPRLPRAFAGGADAGRGAIGEGLLRLASCNASRAASGEALPRRLSICSALRRGAGSGVRALRARCCVYGVYASGARPPRGVVAALLGLAAAAALAFSAFSAAARCRSAAALASAAARVARTRSADTARALDAACALSAALTCSTAAFALACSTAAEATFSAACAFASAAFCRGDDIGGLERTAALATAGDGLRFRVGGSDLRTPAPHARTPAVADADAARLRAIISYAVSGRGGGAAIAADPRGVSDRAREGGFLLTATSALARRRSTPALAWPRGLGEVTRGISGTPRERRAAILSRAEAVRGVSAGAWGSSCCGAEEPKPIGRPPPARVADMDRRWLSRSIAVAGRESSAFPSPPPRGVRAARLTTRAAAARAGGTSSPERSPRGVSAAARGTPPSIEARVGCLFAAIIIAADIRAGSGAGAGGLGGACAGPDSDSDAAPAPGARLRSRLRPRPAPWRVGCLLAVTSSAALERAAARRSAWRSAAAFGGVMRGDAPALLGSQFLGEGILRGDRLGDGLDARAADNRAARASAATRSRASRAFERKRERFQTVAKPRPRDAIPPDLAGRVRFVEGGRVSEEGK
eukprot:1195299-Prorocentrum_minimum.AAC.1